MSGIEGDPYDNYLVIRNELNSYSEKLTKKEEIIVANKMDMIQKKILKFLRKRLKKMYMK